MREKYESLALMNLKEIAKARGIKGTSTMKKNEVIEAVLAEDERLKREEEAKKAEEHEKLKVELIETEYFISSDHEMTKEHYVSFVAMVTGDTVIMRKQYPEWNLQVRIPAFARGRLVWYCTQHGMFYQDIK